MNSKKVLLAEDDLDFANVLKQYLEIYSFEVTHAQNGEEALTLLNENYFDICVFDVMMPLIDGFTLAEEIKKKNKLLPFVFLTAKQLKEDKIRGLQLGADDYIVKPFDADELVLRLQNILKRSQNLLPNPSIQTKISIGNYTLDTERLELVFEKNIQRLTEKEVALLVFLYQNKNTLLKREFILKTIWQTDDFFTGRSMDVFISRLRKYLTGDPSISIISIRKIGLEFKISI